jgi:aspartate aminotransferase
VKDAGIELSPRSATSRSTSVERRPAKDEAVPTPARVSTIAQELAGSLILAIGAEVRALAATGKPICNLTVGDFSPAEFSIPKSLLDGVTAALQAGHTNYPPSDGVEPLRRAISEFYTRRLGLSYALPSVLVTSGARPAIYGAYRVLVDPGDRVVFPVPSWNNNYYSQLIGAEQVTVRCSADTNFLPTAPMLARVLRDARMLVLNSPLNPTGTLFDAETLTEICDLVLAENARRERAGGERPLYLLYDQVYWMLTFGDERHVNPVVLRPEMSPYTILIDAISKSFAATGSSACRTCSATSALGRRAPSRSPRRSCSPTTRGWTRFTRRCVRKYRSVSMRSHASSARSRRKDSRSKQRLRRERST